MQARFRVGAKPCNLQDCRRGMGFPFPQVRRPRKDPPVTSAGKCHGVGRDWGAAVNMGRPGPVTSERDNRNGATGASQTSNRPPAVPEEVIFSRRIFPTGTGTRTPPVLGTVVLLQKFTDSERNVA